MKTSELRKVFTKYFVDNGHQKIQSSSLVPEGDPTLLFTNAGMNQFKDYFTGTVNPPQKRATSIQKCVRAGGKHNDLENVGMTARHHTFFEMLGNFSFGDYFKKDAIHFGWEFLTKTLNIPKDKLYITVHHSDEEASKIWRKQEGVPENKIFKFGDKDNFWAMGDTGPCGPCSEIFYDHGEKHAIPGFSSKNILEDENRYVEVWNLVFMQFNKNAQGEMSPLPKPSIDTGAGLERLAAVMQNKYWNYDTDLFHPIINHLEKITGKEYNDPQVTTAIRVVTDHIRSSSMLITDGVIPSNEGRGYVLRRIIRRAIRHLNELQVKDLSFYKLVPTVFETLKAEYPQNFSNISLAVKLIQTEEAKFKETLDQGLRFLKDALSSEISNKTLPGESAFKLYDTFGFPLDLTETILREKGLKLDQNGFDKCMNNQKEQSRKSWKGGIAQEDDKIFHKYYEKLGKTEFTGYSEFSQEAKLLAVHPLDNGQALIFDKTPFYGESGGQDGDQGEILEGQQFKANIIDTLKPISDFHVHITDNKKIKFEIGKNYILKVSLSKRSQIARNHSATHLLQKALIEILGDHVKQSGSLVNSEKLRFDFTHPQGMSKDDIAKVETIVNKKIEESLIVNPVVMTKDQALKTGAMALFGEKYGDEVRVVRMDNYSIEFCGGTHVNNTSDISTFCIITEGALASGIRRIEALTGQNAIKHLLRRSAILEKLELDLKVKNEMVIERYNALQKETKTNRKMINTLNDKIQSFESEKMFDNTDPIKNGFSFKSAKAEKGSDLRKLSDNFVNKHPKGVLVLHIEESEKISVLLRTHKSNKEINCSSILKETLPLLEGRGGGKPDMAQGSGKKANNLLKFIDRVKQLIIESL